MINYDNVTKETIKNHNPNWPQVPDYPQLILILRGSGSRKTNVFLDLIKQKDDNDYSAIDKIHLYVKNPNETKYQYIIEKMKTVVFKTWKTQNSIFK